MTNEGVVRISRISLVVADLAAAEAFYRDSFGFQVMDQERSDDVDAGRLFGLGGLSETATVLRLGDQHLELVSCTPAGLPYPTPRTSADPWFQHFAIVVRDMGEAHDVLSRRGEMGAISSGGPQHLPPNTGSVTAFKFRDPDGHPLELSMFPPGVGAPKWHEPGPANVLGVDHSGIAIANVDRSTAFYVDLLGMTVTFRGRNIGPEQDRLDGLHSEGVDIIAVQPSDPDSPHIEFLRYPPAVRPHGRAVQPNDVAATRLTLGVGDLAGTVERLRAAGTTFVSPGVVALSTGEAAAIRDPDGHLLVLKPA